MGAIDAAAALGPFVKLAHGVDKKLFFMYFIGCAQPCFQTISAITLVLQLRRSIGAIAFSFNSR